MGFRPETQSIIDRLKAVDRTKPYTLNPSVIQRALDQHLTVLQQPTRPVVYVQSLKAAIEQMRGLARGAARDAAWGAARDAAWDAAWGAACTETLYDHPRFAEFKAVWMPFTDALEAGLFIYWVLNEKILAVPDPLMALLHDQLHCEHGPAIWWPDTDEQYYFLHGVRMESWMVTTAAEVLDPLTLLKVENVEQRRELLRKIGIERFLQKAPHTVLDTQGDYALVAFEFNDRRMVYLKMRNPSIGVWHVEGVARECTTVRDAMHFRKPTALQALPVDNAEGADWYQQGDVCIWPQDAVAVKDRPAILT